MCSHLVALGTEAQADMGLLLVLLFIWNMVGALVLLPAIASMPMCTKKLAETESL
ncbi:hypothetical protein ACU8WE_18520 [Pseudomonas parakoreensis]